MRMSHAGHLSKRTEGGRLPHRAAAKKTGMHEGLSPAFRILMAPRAVTA